MSIPTMVVLFHAEICRLSRKTFNLEDGTDFSVYIWSYYRNSDSWVAVGTNLGAVDTDALYLDKPDSWEKLLEDLERTGTNRPITLLACEYYRQGFMDCRKCSAGGKDCNQRMFADIVDRIRKLRGEGDVDA